VDLVLFSEQVLVLVMLQLGLVKVDLLMELLTST
jgi:hypothetical protein